jgi:hypothetical protein
MLWSSGGKALNERLLSLAVPQNRIYDAILWRIG